MRASPALQIRAKIVVLVAEELLNALRIVR